MRIGEVFDTISEKHHSPTNSSTTSTSTSTTNLAQTNTQTMHGNIRGGNSDTHRDCVSCLEGPRTLPNSNFSDTQLHCSNVRIRCKACVGCQRHKSNVTDHYQQLASINHRDCN